MRWSAPELLAAPQVQVLPELFLGTSKVALDLPELGLLAFTLAGRENRGVLHEPVLQRPDLLLPGKNLAIPRRELALDASSRLGRLWGLIEHYRDVDEPDLEIRSVRRKAMSEHEPQQTDTSRGSPKPVGCMHD